jgi:hypothetical protein
MAIAVTAQAGGDLFLALILPYSLFYAQQLARSFDSFINRKEGARYLGNRREQAERPSTFTI